jgi:outer membrane protein OmpA-like peptidoglycan-associated protein
MTRRIAAAVLLGLSLAGTGAQAQIFDRIKQKIKDKTDALTDSLSGAAIDKVTGAVICAATNVECIKRAFGAGKTVKVVDGSGNAVSAADSSKAVAAAGGVPATLAAASPGGAAPAASAPAFGDGVFLNYDYVPGDRVLFAEDFARDNVGDFPRRLQLREGNFEVADWQGQRFLRTNSGGKLIIPLPEALPARFTFEADYAGPNAFSLEVHFADPGDMPNQTTAYFRPNWGGFDGPNVSAQADLPENAVKPLAHVAVMADGNYAKAYINGVRVSNVPNAALGRDKSIILVVPGGDVAYVGNIRVAAGGKPLYDAIMADGRVSTHGILFDTGSDRIRGESKPTLDQIGQMLRDHADLKLMIEGHTDNVGSAPANQTLSEQRAAAVRQFLISNYGVDASRLASKGYGATKPAASNDTPEGRQQNRRVDLVKM